MHIILKVFINVQPNLKRTTEPEMATVQIRLEFAILLSECNEIHSSLNYLFTSKTKEIDDCCIPLQWHSLGLKWQ